MNRHAYLILAHSNFRQLRKLVELLDDPRNDIYIHVDRKAAFDRQCLDNACMHSRLVILDNRMKVNWGGVSIMRSEIALFEKASSSGEYRYYHLLSGMDLPIKNQDTIHDFFDRHPDRQFIDFWPMTPDTESRVRLFTPFPEGERNFIVHAINKTFRNIALKCGFTINKDVDFRYGSQWCSLTGSFVEYVLSMKAWLEKTFAHAIICDEIFIPTLVWNSPFRDEIFSGSDGNPCNMRLIDWTRGGSIRHPWTFVSDDYERIMASGCLWARKFDERKDPAIIDMIYDTLKPAANHGK